jgi:signal transduction histidine kinase/ActR/RegA family two-component response regulator
MGEATPDSLVAALLAPLGRDARLAAACLTEAGIEAVACADFQELYAKIQEGVGAALVTEEGLTTERVRALAAVVQAQPAWSDLPIIVFSSGAGGLSSRVAAQLQSLGNVSFVDRPVQRRTLVAAVRSALRARQRQYEARKAIVAREQFLAMLGHELRNPLAAILLATDLLGRRYSNDAPLLKYTGSVRRQTRHLRRLVDDLLDVARVTSGKVLLKRERVELSSLVRRSVEAHQNMAEAHGLSLTFDEDSKLAFVDGDVVRLEQVVSNLVTNALKYTPRSGQVWVHVERQGGDAVLTVSDTGVGIAREHLPLIFDLFEQAPTALDRSRGGLGLGLTLVRSLVELQGGKVAARSEGPGLGSAFEVRLPLVEPGDAVVAAADAFAAPAIAPQPQPGRVVIVDDNDEVREALTELLTMEGYEVEAADDGPQGLTRIMSSRPAAALVDIGLPGFDGYELARRARRVLGDSLMLVAMTGYGQAEDRARAAAAGFDAHLTKPVSVEEIQAILAQPRLKSLQPGP